MTPFLQYIFNEPAISLAGYFLDMPSATYYNKKQL